MGKIQETGQVTIAAAFEAGARMIKKKSDHGLECGWSAYNLLPELEIWTYMYYYGIH
jgi:hypothetical protein